MSLAGEIYEDLLYIGSEGLMGLCPPAGITAENLALYFTPEGGKTLEVRAGLPSTPKLWHSLAASSTHTRCLAMCS